MIAPRPFEPDAAALAAAGDYPVLSMSQLRVLHSLSEGASVREIAEGRRTTPTSVRGLLRRACTALGATTPTHAVAIALRTRLID